MASITTLAVVLLVSDPAARAAQECPVALTIEFLVREVELTSDGYLWGDAVQASLKNVGSGPVTLVQPGDGSERESRTPTVTWVIDGQSRTLDRGGCGNINPLQADEVFVLAPGQTLALTDWIPPIHLKRSGTYEVQLIYRNDPTMEVVGIPLGQHDLEALQRVKRSTPCELRSNIVRLKARMPAPGDSIPQLAHHVTAMLLPWALEDAPLAGAPHDAGLRFPDEKCVHAFLDSAQPPFIFVNWQGPGFSAHQEATWKWVRQGRKLEPLTAAESEEFTSHVLSAPYVPGPWFKIALDQRADGSVPLTFRYGHAAGSMELHYVGGDLQLRDRVFLELDDVASVDP